MWEHRTPTTRQTDKKAYLPRPNPYQNWQACFTAYIRPNTWLREQASEDWPDACAEESRVAVWTPPSAIGTCYSTCTGRFHANPFPTPSLVLLASSSLRALPNLLLLSLSSLALTPSCFLCCCSHWPGGPWKVLSLGHSDIIPRAKTVTDNSNC